MSQTQPIPPGRKQTGVPRRFGMGVLLVITTMYAVLFACLHSCPPLVFLTVAGFFTVVGVGQAVLYQGRDPRRASVVTGTVLSALLPPVAAVLTVCIRGISTTELLGVVHLTLIITGISVCLGGLLGYLAGLLIAGVFFFFNKWQPPLEDEEPPEEKITPSPVIQENEEQVSAE